MRRVVAIACIAARVWSPSVAAAQVEPLAVIGTRSPAVAVTLATFLPGAGQVYAGRPVVGVALMSGFVVGQAVGLHGMASINDHRGPYRARNPALGSVGVAMLVGAYVYSLGTAARDVDRHNALALQRAFSTASLGGAGVRQTLSRVLAHNDHIRLQARPAIVGKEVGIVAAPTIEGWLDSLTSASLRFRLDTISAEPREMLISDIAAIEVERPGASGLRRIGFGTLGYLVGGAPVSSIDCRGRGPECISLPGVIVGIGGAIVGWKAADRGATHWERIVLVAP